MFPITGKSARGASFRSVTTNAGIKDFVFHDLRATSITWMDLAGVSEGVKKNIVGHTTSDVHQSYNRMSENVLQDARDKMNAFRRKIDAQTLPENTENGTEPDGQGETAGEAAKHSA